MFVTINRIIDTYGYNVYNVEMKRRPARLSVAATKSGTDYYLLLGFGGKEVEIVVKDEEMQEFFRAYLLARQEHVDKGRLSDN